MKKFILPLIAVTAIGCSSSPEQNEDAVDNRTVEEINAERGDPCDLSLIHISEPTRR